MNNSRRVALLFAFAAAVSGSALAQSPTADATDMQALREAVKKDRRGFVAATLGLTDAQAKKFWPIYDTYLRAVEAANRQRALSIETLLSRDRPITDLYAKQLANELVSSDEAEVKARRTLYRQLMRALPATKVARCLQLESKIRAVQNYDLATTFPLIR